MSELSNQNLGLLALAASSEKKWFFGHVGAGLLAIDALRTLEPEAHVTSAVDEYRRQCIELIQEVDRTSWLSGVVGAPGDWRDRILAAAMPLARKLRNSGHGVIYMFWAYRTLSGWADMATDQVLGGLEKLAQASLSDDLDRYLCVANHDRTGAADQKIPDGAAERIELAFRASRPAFLNKTVDDKKYHLAGERFHIMTYLHALLEWRRLGCSDLHDVGLAAWAKHLHLCECADTEARARGYEQVRLSGPVGGFYDGLRSNVHAYKYRQAGLDLLSNHYSRSPRELEPILEQVCRLWVK